MLEVLTLYLNSVISAENRRPPANLPQSYSNVLKLPRQTARNGNLGMAQNQPSDKPVLEQLCNGFTAEEIMSMVPENSAAPVVSFGLSYEVTTELPTGVKTYSVDNLIKAYDLSGKPPLKEEGYFGPGFGRLARIEVIDPATGKVMAVMFKYQNGGKEQYFMAAKIPYKEKDHPYEEKNLQLAGCSKFWSLENFYTMMLSITSTRLFGRPDLIKMPKSKPKPLAPVTETKPRWAN